MSGPIQGTPFLGCCGEPTQDFLWRWNFTLPTSIFAPIVGEPTEVNFCGNNPLYPRIFSTYLTLPVRASNRITGLGPANFSPGKYYLSMDYSCNTGAYDCEWQTPWLSLFVAPTAPEPGSPLSIDGLTHAGWIFARQGGTGAFGWWQQPLFELVFHCFGNIPLNQGGRLYFELTGTETIIVAIGTYSQDPGNPTSFGIWEASGNVVSVPEQDWPPGIPP